MRTPSTCAECGKSFEARAYGSSFCGTPCKRAFNNRRAQRGALLYDLVMVALENPELDARYGNVSSRQAALVQRWRDEDAASGRKRTTQRVFEIHERTLPLAVRVTRSSGG